MEYKPKSDSNSTAEIIEKSNIQDNPNIPLTEKDFFLNKVEKFLDEKIIKNIPISEDSIFINKTELYLTSTTIENTTNFIANLEITFESEVL